MGYQRPPIKLTWDESTDLHGLEVRTRRPSIGDLLELLAMETDETVSGLDYLAQRALRVVIDWNLQDDTGQPVPVTEAGIRGQDRWLLQAIVNEANQAATRLSPPLPKPSADGEQSPEASIPMEPLSPNPPPPSEPA